MTVETQAEADAPGEIPFLRIAIGTGQREAFKVDDEVALRPCLSEAELTRAMSGNTQAAAAVSVSADRDRPGEPRRPRLFGMSMSEEARGFAPLVAADVLRGYTPTERLGVLRRVTRALGDRDICEALNRQQREATAAARKKK